MLRGCPGLDPEVGQGKRQIRHQQQRMPFMFLKDTEVSRRREVGITVSNDFLLFGRRSNYYSHNANISLGNNVVCSLNG